MRIRWKAVPVTAAVAAAGLLAAACGSHIQPSLAQYGITTGHGNFSSTKVITVTPPGVNRHVGTGTTTWYVYADVRNYVTNPTNGDRARPQQEITGSAGGQPGMADYVYTYVTFEINPAIAVNKNNWALADNFLAFCLKYACASQQPQNNTSTASLKRSSAPGWLSMINEVFPRAIDNATRTAIQSFGPGLWNDQAQWNSLGDKIAGALPSQIVAMDGSPAGQPYFCGAGSTVKVCKPFQVEVTQVTPVSPQVQQAYQQQQTALYQAQSGKERLAAAKLLYGPDANLVLGLEDLVTECGQQHVTCKIYLGNLPFKP